MFLRSAWAVLMSCTTFPASLSPKWSATALSAMDEKEEKGGGEG